MSYLYVCEQGAVIGCEANRFQVRYKDGMLKSVPGETLEVIEIFGKVQLLTTQCMTECLRRGITVFFLFVKRCLLWSTHFYESCQRSEAAQSGGAERGI